ncbi:MAG: precorrin-2/cobalt-factor-2 C20-methyltransferase [Hyphomicrobiaceae bacterium]|jgi:precorrin-2/cobalt-factor-2 C20-methyltransferase
MSKGIIYGVGLGPGDPDLMSVKADRLVRLARHVAFFRKKGRPGQARQIVEGMLADGVSEYPMEYPVTTEIPFEDPRYNEQLSTFYGGCAERLLDLAQSGEEVVVLCEGDPLFYGSFMHLHSRLSGTVPVEIVPAITGMSGAWTAVGQPFTWGDDVLTVLMATLPEDEFNRRVADTDALVVMKIGRNLAKVRRALEAAGKLQDAWLVEYAMMPNQTVQRLAEFQLEIAPYFSIVLIPGQGRRP